ncbi:MAG: MATE family efflux transporter [Lachnospiraceae bacterium]|nr:MATE family efflux transporter [Lachnospiraceae bacterium]
MNEEKLTPSQLKYKMMTETPVPKLIMKLAVPTILSMLVTGFYNMADTYFVGKITTEDTAAVGLVFSVMALIQAVGFFCGQGSGTFLSRMLGAGEKKKAEEMAATGFVVAAILGVIIAILGNIYAHPLAYIMGADENSVEKTVQYMRIILIGTPFMTCQFVVNNQLRFQGSAFYAMIGLFCGAAVNVILDPIMIFGFHMGISGAAVATISAQFISFIILLNGTTKGSNLRLNLKNVRFRFFYLKEIVNGGMASLLRQGLAAVATLLMNNKAQELGSNAAVAAMSIVTKIVMMIGCAMIGFGQGFQPVCSFNYGAGLKKRVREGFFFCFKYGTIFLTFGAAILIVFADLIVYLMRDDMAVVEIGKVALRWQAATLPLLGFSSMANMMLQSTGKGFKASIASSCRSGLCFIPLLYLLTYFYGIQGLEATQAIADILALIIAIPLAVTELAKMKDNS